MPRFRSEPPGDATRSQRVPRVDAGAGGHDLGAQLVGRGSPEPKLNPGVDTERPLAAGTVLQLPAVLTGPPSAVPPAPPGPPPPP